MEDGEVVAGEADPFEYDEVVNTKDTETTDAFYYWCGATCDDSGPLC